MLRKTFTIREFAESFGVCDKTVRRMIDAGELRVIRLRGAIRIPVGELDRLLDSAA